MPNSEILRIQEIVFPRWLLSSISYLLPPLALDFVKEDCGGSGDVERINIGNHGDGHSLVAMVQQRLGYPVAFAAKQDAAVTLETGLRQIFGGGVGVRGD